MINILKNRFNENRMRHPHLEWEYVEARLSENIEVLDILKQMEEREAGQANR